MTAELIERLRQDAQRLRSLSRIETDTFRWIGEPKGWRKKTDVADDIEALIELVGKQQ